MSATAQASGRTPSSGFVVIIGLWVAATLLSAMQIYWRELARGFEVPFDEVLLANVLAWLPWLAIAPAGLWLERRFPVAGASAWTHLAIHAASAVVTALTFLFYLAVFHVVYLERGSLSPSTVRSEYAEKIGEYFLVAVGLYVAIVLSSFGWHTWVALRAERRRGESLAARAVVEGDQDSRPPAPLIARSVGEVEKIDPQEVDWIESRGNYARLHLGDRQVLIRRTLGSLCDELVDSGFVRIHRSAIVNSGRVARVSTSTHGDAFVELSTGRRLKVSRTYRQALENAAL